MSYFDRQILVVFTSIPGSGKSYFARHLADHIGAIRLSSDALRPAMYGSVKAWQEAEAVDGRPIMLKRLFDTMDYMTDQVLAAKVDLIYDANTNRHELRRAKAKTARAHGAVLIIVHLDVPYEVALQRGQDREEQDDQRRKDEPGMRALIDRIQAATDPFEPDEPVVHLDGQAPFSDQFAEFERQVNSLLAKDNSKIGQTVFVDNEEV